MKVEHKGSHPPQVPTERISSLDVLRGAALFGMVLVHLHDRAVVAYGSTGLVQEAIALFVVGTARTVFGILFGVSFAIQLSRAEQRGAPFTWPFLRRLAGLAAPDLRTARMLDTLREARAIIAPIAAESRRVARDCARASSATSPR